MDNNGVKGLSNPLSMINPQDIESFNNVLKDVMQPQSTVHVVPMVSSSSLPKGHKGQKMSIAYNGSVTMSMKKKTIDVMDGDQFRDFVKTLYTGNTRYDAAMAALGTSNTDWQDEIYRTAISTDHNVTLCRLCRHSSSIPRFFLAILESKVF